MTTESLSSTEQERTAQHLIHDNPHYLASVTRLGDKHALVASYDIVNQKGIKLLARGAPVNSRVYEKLLGHALSQPLDQQVTLGDALTPEQMAREAAQWLDNDPWWKKMAERSGDALGLRHALARLRLPPPVCFKLTLAREQRGRLYHHSLRVALLTHYLGLRLGLPGAALEKATTAGLCHDLGELHTEASLLNPEHKITDEERRFVYVHPVTGSLILKAIPGMDPDIIKAVLHHHERLDASGYPYGLRGDQISPLARLVMVADVAETILTRFSDPGRLSTLLRLNLKKYDRTIVAYVHDVLGGESPIYRQGEAFASEVSDRLTRIAEVWTAWSRLRPQLATGPQGERHPVLGFLNERMGTLNSMWLQFGFDPASVDLLPTLAREDAHVASELRAVLDELQFQLDEIEREIVRRDATLQAAMQAEHKEAFADWRQILGKARTA